MDVCYRPVNETSGVQEGEVVLACPELGSYPYKVEYQATGAGVEKGMVLKAPLGLSATETFRFFHYAKKAAT